MSSCIIGLITAVRRKKCLNKNTKHNIWCAKARVEFYFIIMFRFTYSVRNQSLVFFLIYKTHIYYLVCHGGFILIINSKIVFENKLILPYFNLTQYLVNG